LLSLCGSLELPNQSILPIQHRSTISDLRFSYSAFCVAPLGVGDDGAKAIPPNFTITAADSFFSPYGFIT